MCNTRRLEDIVIVMEDCLIKLDNFRDAYKNTENMYTKLFMEEGFKGYLKSFQEQLVKYLAHTSKGLYNKRDKLKYIDIIEIHKKNNQLENVSLEFLLQLRNDRNYFAHGYEQPEFQGIYNFFYRYRNEFDEVILCVKNTIKRELENKENKENSKSQLLDSIEIAKNLLDVLDDETISKKLGLDIEIIKSLRN